MMRLAAAVLRTMRAAGFPAALLLMAGGCSDGRTIMDNFGSPSGYAAVEAGVYCANGAGGPAGMDVVLTRCGYPVGGLPVSLLGGSRRAARGRCAW